MKVAGIVSEYNPFHLGHARQITELRALLGADTAIVCVMSGNFVQRGDFALFGKHARAEAAVRCGADLVVELPLPFCLSSAEKFAGGAVRLLDSMGCVSHLAFGSECAALEPLQKAARAVCSPEADRLIGDRLSKGVSYAVARHTAASALIGRDADVLRQPNNILAVEYLKALSRLGSDIEPVTLPRYGSGHDEGGAATGYSASALREAILSKGDWQGLVPAPAYDVYAAEIEAGRGPVHYSNCERAILARLRCLPDEAWQKLPGNAEGLSDRIMRYARKCVSVEEILSACRTKRYALSRIRRMLLIAYLGLEAGDFIESPAYIRPLAFSPAGRKLLREISDFSPLPLITKPADWKSSARFARDAAATDLYVLACPELSNAEGGGEWRKSPVFVRSRQPEQL